MIGLVVLLLAGLSFGLEVNKCQVGDIPLPIQVENEGCEKTPCPLVKGTVSNMNATFLIPHDTEFSKIEILAYTFGMWVKFPPPDDEVCHYLVNSYCPLEEGEKVIYNLALPIAKAYPKLKLLLRLTFKDDKDQPMMCFEIPCQVVDP